MLNNYKGTIIMVSHDRYLIKNITNIEIIIKQGYAIVVLIEKFLYFIKL